MKFLMNHRFEARLISFLTLVLISIFLYPAAESGSQSAIWSLLGVAILGSLLALAVP